MDWKIIAVLGIVVSAAVVIFDPLNPVGRAAYTSLFVFNELSKSEQVFAAQCREELHARADWNKFKIYINDMCSCMAVEVVASPELRSGSITKERAKHLSDEIGTSCGKQIRKG